ncbi:MAG TPA: hypothetical protein VJJ23_04485 [Candidatus Nanoarchaeia archaeon]|nr:hypothetical protein [Candidatus Nanoarchaeia archaeon]
MDEETRRKVDEEIRKRKEHQDYVLKEYPDALRRIEEYRKTYDQGNLFESDDKLTLAREIQDVYLAARLKGFKPTRRDLELKIITSWMLKPEILEELAERLESDELVD